MGSGPGRAQENLAVEACFSHDFYKEFHIKDAENLKIFSPAAHKHQQKRFRVCIEIAKGL